MNGRTTEEPYDKQQRFDSQIFCIDLGINDQNLKME